MTNKKFADGLRAAADFYEQHPEIPAPSSTVDVYHYGLNTKEEAAMLARALGSCKKEYSESCLTISKKYGQAVNLRFLFTRDNVCTRRVVGVETIPAKFIEAYTELAQTKEIVEWECEPILEPTQQADEAAA